MTNSNKIFASPFYKVGGVYAISFSLSLDQSEPDKLSVASLKCEWYPHFPTQSDLKRKIDIQKYEIAKDKFLADFAEKPGFNIACFSL